MHRFAFIRRLRSGYKNLDFVGKLAKKICVYLFTCVICVPFAPTLTNLLGSFVNGLRQNPALHRLVLTRAERSRSSRVEVAKPRCKSCKSCAASSGAEVLILRARLGLNFMGRWRKQHPSLCVARNSPPYFANGHTQRPWAEKYPISLSFSTRYRPAPAISMSWYSAGSSLSPLAPTRPYN